MTEGLEHLSLGLQDVQFNGCATVLFDSIDKDVGRRNCHIHPATQEQVLFVIKERMR